MWGEVDCESCGGTGDEPGPPGYWMAGSSMEPAQSRLGPQYQTQLSEGLAHSNLVPQLDVSAQRLESSAQMAGSSTEPALSSHEPRLEVSAQMDGEYYSSRFPCGDCNGSGKQAVWYDSCRNCGGRGTVEGGVKCARCNGLGFHEPEPSSKLSRWEEVTEF